MPRPKQRTAALRDHVLSSSVDLLAREGAAGFTARNVARSAGTSTPAVYELFGDKAGLVKAVCFEGFALLADHLRAVGETEDPLADVVSVVQAYRTFVLANPVLTEVMLSRPFSEFDPTEAEREAGAAVRGFVVDRVRRCVEAGLLVGDPVDVAQAVFALTQGLAMAESAHRLGTTQQTIDRRWDVAICALLTGLGGPGSEL